MLDSLWRSCVVKRVLRCIMYMNSYSLYFIIIMIFLFLDIISGWVWRKYQRKLNWNVSWVVTCIDLMRKKVNVFDFHYHSFFCIINLQNKSLWKKPMFTSISLICCWNIGMICLTLNNYYLSRICFHYSSSVNSFMCCVFLNAQLYLLESVLKGHTFIVQFSTCCTLVYYDVWSIDKLFEN